jgi:hypothetical protein
MVVEYLFAIIVLSIQYLFAILVVVSPVLSVVGLQRRTVSLVCFIFFGRSSGEFCL